MYKCFIVDDEPLALHVIEQHLSKFKDFTVCGKSTNPVEALTMVKSLKPDLLFLDIAMPDITGLEFIESLQHKPAIILTTAYREYAVEGFNLHVLDYLVKPIPFKRFVQAIDKFLELHRPHEIAIPQETGSFLNIKADRKTIRIDLDDILYAEGVKDYVKIVTRGQHIVTRISVGHFMNELPRDRFIQVHKSFIVAKNKITAYTMQDVEIGKIEIPIGRIYKDAFMTAMANDFLKSSS